MQIVIPMCGSGSRFSDAGYSLPKPLIPVVGKPMLFWAMENLPFVTSDNPVHMIVRRDQLAGFPQFAEVIGRCRPTPSLVKIDGPTPSPLHTLVRAVEVLNPEQPVMILNCDQFLARPILDEVQHFLRSSAAGAAFTLESSSADYLHLATNGMGDIVEVLGRGSFAAPAAAGIYLFRSPELLFTGIRELLSAPLTREHCVTDLLTWLIGQGHRILSLPIGSPGSRFHSLGTPALVEQFKAYLISI